jgi:beta-lactam-binding protein with PASTA domain
VFKFLTSKPLWVNILAGIVLLLLLLLLFLGSLALLTQHGKTMKIPSVTGMLFADAKKALQSQGFEVQIQDSSAYVDTMKPMQVVKQFPEADNLVKTNRTIYLTINRSQAPMIQMPNLVSMSLRNAVAVLRQYGLNVGDTVYKPDFARNSVLDQQYNGETVKPGASIQQGSSITLVLGSGVGGQQFVVPDLIGLTYGQARARLDSLGLSIGSVRKMPEVRDTAESYIISQDPPQFGDGGIVNYIRMGQAIGITLGIRKPGQNGDSTSPAPGGN